MPSILLTTNVELSDVKPFVLQLSKIGAETFNVPEKFISACYTYNSSLSFSGTFEPAINLTINGFGLSPQANEHHSKAFFDFFKEKLNVPGDRGYITFVDPGQAYIGHNGTTFEKIFAK